jgi:membrane-associated phospholipid phosphatase
MDTLFETGLEWIIALQAVHGPVIDSFFRGITFMGEEMFFLLFIPFLFWSVDTAIGARVGIAFLLSAYLNPVLKDIFQEPRPFNLNSSIKLSDAEGGGMPSGHAQTSVMVWGTLAWQVGKKWVWGIAISLMLLIGFSRVFLGVHFPHQVVAGWMVGIVILMAYILLDPRIEPWLTGLRLHEQLAVAFFVPVLLALVFLSDSTVAAMAVMTGFGCGLALAHHYVPFSAAGHWWQRLLRYVIGAAVMLGIYVGLSALFPETDGGVYYLLRFIRYGLVGLWISLGAPWLFGQLHLAETAVTQPQLES